MWHDTKQRQLQALQSSLSHLLCSMPVFDSRCHSIPLPLLSLLSLQEWDDDSPPSLLPPTPWDKGHARVGTAGRILQLSRLVQVGGPRYGTRVGGEGAYGVWVQCHKIEQKHKTEKKSMGRRSFVCVCVSCPHMLCVCVLGEVVVGGV